VPRSAALRGCAEELQQRCVFEGGDDYELLFTAAPSQRVAVAAAGAAGGVTVTRIGAISVGRGLTVRAADGREMDRPARAFDHFTR
jgi:thiamine-monophosphate kinase